MRPSDRQRWLMLTVLALLLALCLSFGWWQNTHGSLGGKISWEKSLWIFTALTFFYLLPAWLWLDRSVDAATRKFAGIFLVGFILRALVELPLLIFTLAWRCWHGVSHDVLMLGVVLVALPKLPSGPGRNFARLLVVVLFCEILNAWMFGFTGSPETGIYFADDSSRFALINQITRWELLACLTGLTLWLRSYFTTSRP
jgi:hypothetical protein